MATSEGSDQSQVAAQVWRTLYDFCQTEYARHLAAAAELGLSPGLLKALMWFDPDEAHPMRVLADQWGSDASTVTWLVNRLEEQGLVERHAHATDRRVKVVALTEQGHKTRTELLTRLYRPPTAFTDLSPAELHVLRNLMPKLL